MSPLPKNKVFLVQSHSDDVDDVIHRSRKPLTLILNVRNILQYFFRVI